MQIVLLNTLTPAYSKNDKMYKNHLMLLVMLLCYNHNHVAVAVGHCLGPVKEKVVGVGKLKLLQQLNI